MRSTALLLSVAAVAANDPIYGSDEGALVKLTDANFESEMFPDRDEL